MIEYLQKWKVSRLASSLKAAGEIASQNND